MNSLASEEALINAIRALNQDARLSEVISALTEMNMQSGLQGVIEALSGLSESLKALPNYEKTLQEIVTAVQQQQQHQQQQPVVVPVVPVEPVKIKDLYVDIVTRGDYEKQILNVNVPSNTNTSITIRG